MKRFVLSANATVLLVVLILFCMFPVSVQASLWTVCPSGCNYSSIQDAINAASPGDTIGIESGVYHESLVVNKSLTLTGVDTGQGYPVIDAGKRGVGILVEAAGCNLEKLEVRNASHSAIIVGADNSGLDSLQINHKGTGPAISGDQVTGFTCSNSRFNTEGNTIVLQDSHDFSITNNTFGNPGGKSVAIVSSNRKKPVTNGTISNNFITQDLGSGIGIVAKSSDSYIENLLVENNTIRGAGGSIGLFIPSRNVTIQGNTITNNPKISGKGIYGIMIYGTSGVIVRNNTVHDAQVELAYRFESCDGLNISGNRAISNDDTGIGLIGPTNCVMTNNVMEGNPYNFLLYPDILDEGRLPGNRIDTTNLVDGRPVLYYEGINNLLIDGSMQPGTVFLYGCNNATVRDIHEEANDAGITAFNSDDLLITNCSLENMDTGIYTVQSDGLSVQNNHVNGCFDGIMVGAFSSGAVTGNLIEDSGDSGIVAGEFLDNVTIYGNDIRGSKAAIYLDGVSGSNNVIFSKNLITGSQVAGISANQAGGCALTGKQINAVSGVGMDIEESSDLTITGNTVGGKAARGVLLFESPNNNISTNNISAGEEGFTFTRLAGDIGSKDNSITNNRIDAIAPAGFYIQKGTGVATPKFNRSLETSVDEIPAMVLTSNTTTPAGEDSGFKPDHSPPANTWNLSVTAGPNIVGGPYIGGNYWENPKGNGFSQTHPDRGDGFCNESYVLGKGNTDYLPLHLYSPKPSFYADFVVSPISGTAPLTVKCTDKSIGNPSMFVYNFGDGINVTGPNPTHTYRFPGVYTVTLSVMKYNTTSNSIMNSVAVKPNIVTVNKVPLAPLVANFTAGPVNGTAPLTVSFTDHSTGDPTFYNYDFGDGANMTGPNPVHTYRYSGNYTVRLTVMKNDAANGSMVANSSVRQDYIVIQGK
jgi:parallel beta-helix repeat protein